MKILYHLAVCLLLSSCHQSIDIEYSLSQGLTNLKNCRKIDKSFIEGIELQKFAVIKKNDSINYLIFQLNDNINSAFFEEYKMGVLFNFNETNSELAGLESGDSKKWFDFSPKVTSSNNYKYTINKITTHAKKVEEITLYIYKYDGKKITHLEKNKIYIKSITLI